MDIQAAHYPLVEVPFGKTTPEIKTWTAAASHVAIQAVAYNARFKIEALEEVIADELSSLGFLGNRTELAADVVDWLVTSPCAPASYHTDREYVYYRPDSACHACCAVAHQAYDVAMAHHGT